MKENKIVFWLLPIILVITALLVGCGGSKTIPVGGVAPNQNIKPEATGQESQDIKSEAANLAMQAIGAPYNTSGAKGWDWKEAKFVDSNILKDGYHWNYQNHDEVGKGLDCSGLVFWAFNKAAGITSYQDSKSPVREEGANGQWNDTSRLNKTPTTTPPQISELKPGDLLFLDTPDDGIGVVDHVGIYVGNGEVVHSQGDRGVEKLTLADWLILPTGGKTYKDWFVGYGTVK